MPVPCVCQVLQQSGRLLCSTRSPCSQKSVLEGREKDPSSSLGFFLPAYFLMLLLLEGFFCKKSHVYFPARRLEHTQSPCQAAERRGSLAGNSVSHLGEREAPVLGMATTVAYGPGMAAHPRSGCWLPAAMGAGCRLCPAPAAAAMEHPRPACGPGVHAWLGWRCAGCPGSKQLCGFSALQTPCVSLLGQLCPLPCAFCSRAPEQEELAFAGGKSCSRFLPESSLLLLASRRALLPAHQRWPYLGLCPARSPPRDVAPSTRVTRRPFTAPMDAATLPPRAVGACRPSSAQGRLWLCFALRLLFLGGFQRTTEPRPASASAERLLLRLHRLQVTVLT